MSYIRCDLVTQARLLSGGTIASLTGKRRYDEIDPIHAEFEEFCEENKSRFETWTEAWREYQKAKGNK